MVSASHKSVGLNTQWQTTAIRGSGILVQSIFREKKLNKKREVFILIKGLLGETWTQIQSKMQKNTCQIPKGLGAIRTSR